MNEINFDLKQRELALDITKSYIVQAPAGSGKTELLIQRFLKLLNHVKKPEEILAITFTKKAASEMRERVIKALKEANEGFNLCATQITPHQERTLFLAKEVLIRDKLFNWNILQNPNQLRIQTIDSLCTYLTKQLPLLSQFGSEPAISNQPLFLYREAVDNVLLHIEEDFQWTPHISQLLKHLDNDLNKLQELLINLLSKRDQWLPYIGLHSVETEVKAKLEEHLATIITQHLYSLKQLFPQDLATELLAITRFAANNIGDKTTALSKCSHLFELPSTNIFDKEYWLVLSELLLTKTFSWRKRLTEDLGFPNLKNLKNAEELALHNHYRERFSELITSLTAHEGLRTALMELSFLPEPFYDDKQWQILQALLHVMKIVVAQLRVTFAQQGQIDFIENALSALFALGSDDNPTDLVMALDYQIQHIMIDEFQDTSYTQYQLLQKLIIGWEANDGRTLFVVGDPMQSIYSFREAEVSFFIRMQQLGIGQIKLQPLILSTNFRSSKTIVDWNNEHFQQIFPAENSIEISAISFSRSIAQSANNLDTSKVVIKGFSDKNPTVEAQEIVATVQELKMTHPQEKIAILVRSRTHLKAIIPALKQAQLSFRAVDIDPLIAHQSIKDLLSLTSALLHPADRIAWLSILRAPWCGLTLNDLAIIASSPFALICEQLENDEVINKLSKDGQFRLQRVIPILKTTFKERGRASLTNVLEKTWILLGGPAGLKDFNEIEDINTFFNILEELLQQDPHINIQKINEKITNFYASPQADDHLQIMTIHSAKGLEFDTVILPHLERKSLNDEQPILTWMEKPTANNKTALLIAPIHGRGENVDSIYRYIRLQQKLKLEQELNRLFYVATTRAKTRLYLFFSCEKNSKNEWQIEQGSFLSKLWPLIQHQENDLITLPKNQIKMHPILQERYIKRLRVNWQNPVFDNTVVSANIHQQQNGFQLLTNQKQTIGIVVHSILQSISQLNLNWWLDKQHLDKMHYLRYQYMQCGILKADDISLLSQLTLPIIDNAIHDPRGQWILYAHKEAKSECALTALIDNKIEYLVIDRTFIDEKGVRWIIDYKTSTLSHQELEEFLAKEQQKYLSKMEKYSKAMQFLDDRSIKLGLYFPAIKAWQEWEC